MRLNKEVLSIQIRELDTWVSSTLQMLGIWKRSDVCRSVKDGGQTLNAKYAVNIDWNPNEVGCLKK